MEPVWQTWEQRQKDGTKLFEQKAYAEAFSIFKKLAEDWIDAITPRFGGKNIDAAEWAVQSYVWVIICLEAMIEEQGWTDELTLQLTINVEHLFSLNSLITKRYGTKVMLLLYVARANILLENLDEARQQLIAARRFYEQQLLPRAEWDKEAQSLGKLLKEVTTLLDEEEPSPTQSIKFTVTADTQTDLEIIIRHLSATQAKLTVTRKSTAKRTSNNPRSGSRFTATLRIDIDGKNTMNKRG